jgi:hypothetical protein
MPTTHRIDATSGIVYLVAIGTTTQEDWIETRSQIVADPQYCPGMSALIDGRRHESLLSIEFITNIAHGPRVRAGPADTPRWAIVVSREVAYGLGRMFSTLAESTNTEVRVFREFDEAERWLKDVGASPGDSSEGGGTPSLGAKE